MEENKKFIITDAQGNEHEIDQSAFDLVQADKKIHDVKFETKPTTFFKDSLRRFAKNKASVAGFIIIGMIIICSILIPTLDVSDISHTHPLERYLEPKLFDAGTGWWDGTKVYEDIMYDQNTNCPDPENFSIRGVSELELGEIYLSNLANKYGIDGDFQLYNPKLDSASKAAQVEEKFLRSYEIPKVDLTKTLDLTYQIIDKTNDVYVNTDYKVTVRFTSLIPGESYTELILADYSKNYETVSFDVVGAINDYLASESISATKVTKLSINFLFETSFDEARQILFDHVELVSNDDTVVDDRDRTVMDYCNAISFKSGNELALQKKNINDDSSNPNIEYWSSTAFRGVIDVQLRKCKFRYNLYEVYYGDISGYIIDADTMNQYRKSGLCEYKIKEGPSSFKALSEKCPIVSVEEQSKDSAGRYQFTCTVTQYKILGYDQMPRWLFGTDSNGKDFIKLVFYGVSISLLLGVVVFAVCFTFGLVWGAISGYFGGTVDLAMERFCDILGGIPWIVLMTLIILLLGNNFTTFAIALCLTGWMGTAGRTRTQFYRFKNREYVLASRTLGASDLRLIFKHVLPNAMGTIITGAVLIIPSTVFSESTIAYLGLGLSGDGSLGTILAGNQGEIAAHPYLLLIPSVVIALLMISFNLFGNGLRDAVNPSLKGSD